MAAQREWFEKDYYSVLGVNKDVDSVALKKAYRKLASQYHPDANPGDTKAEERFKDISAAYDVIGDEVKRKEYDEVRAAGPGGYGSFGGQGTRGGSSDFGGGFGGGSQGNFDVSDLLGNLFGGNGRQRGGAPRGPQPEQGSDLETNLHLEFMDAVNGITTEVHLTSNATCSTCEGSGCEPGTRPGQCPRCNGRGVVDDNQGPFSFTQPCRLCSGRGTVIDHPCKTCKGRGVERRARQVKVRIPAGVNDGARIKLAQRGEPGRFNGPAGDLYVNVRVKPHEIFGRDGLNLVLHVPVSFAEAVHGSKVTIPTLDNGGITLKLAPGTQSGTTQRLKGRGIANAKHVGDLMVTWDVAVPTKLNSAEKKAIEALQKAGGVDARAHLNAYLDRTLDDTGEA